MPRRPVRFPKHDSLADTLAKRVHDVKPVDCAGLLKVLRENNATAGLLGRSKNQRIPERKAVKPLEIDGSEDVGDFGSGDIELGEQFDLPARNARIKVQLARDGDEILLKHLQRHNAGSGAAVFSQEIEGAALLRGRSLVVRVNQDIGVEEATSAHEFRFD